MTEFSWLYSSPQDNCLGVWVDIPVGGFPGKSVINKACLETPQDILPHTSRVVLLLGTNEASL
jgi:hypothetical protein